MRTPDQTEIVSELMRGNERTGVGESAVVEVTGNGGRHAVGLQGDYVDSDVRRSKLRRYSLSNRGSGNGCVESVDGVRSEDIGIAESAGLDQIVGADRNDGREDGCSSGGRRALGRRRRFVRRK